MVAEGAFVGDLGEEVGLRGHFTAVGELRLRRAHAVEFLHVTALAVLMVDIRGCTEGLPVLVQRVVAAAGLQHQPLDPGHFPLEKERSLELLVLQVVISGVVAHHVHPVLVSAQRLEIIRSGPVGLPIRMIEEDMARHLGTRKIGYVALVERSGQIQSHGQAPGDLHVYIRTDIVLAVLAARFLETVALHQFTD